MDNVRRSLVQHSSASVEHYTPSDIVERARLCLGEIDLDPASCEEANQIVKANSFLGKEDDGFSRNWHGRVFLNPPGGRMIGNKSSQKEWYWKLAREYLMGRVESGVFVAFSVELLQTTQVNVPTDLIPPARLPFCIPKRRVAYVTPGGKTGKSPPHSSAILFIGSQKEQFKACFESLGEVVNV